MKLWTITVCHAPLRILKRGLNDYYTTSSVLSEHVLVDHHYPLEPWETRRGLLLEAQARNLKVITPYVNLGGHGGFNWALSQLPIGDSDIVIGYDPDSIPKTKGWDAAMVSALTNHHDLVGIHLMPSHIKRNWTYDGASPRVATPDRIDMWGVTAWKASFIKKVSLLAAYSFYGQVELPMYEECRRQGVRLAYLADYFEDFLPEEHDPIYTEWKAAHVAGDSRNFDQYVKERASQ